MNISVYITSYNKSKYLTKAIESVLNQSFQPFEIIIVDDYSVDKSREIISSFYKRYPNIIIPIYNEKNLGISQSRNIALKNLQGEIVTFLDGDDYYYPKKLENEYLVLKQNTNSHAVYSNFHYIDESGNILGNFAKDTDNPATGDIFINTFTRNYNVQSRNNYIYEMFYNNCASEIGFYDKNLILWEDWDFRIRMSNIFKYRYCSKINSVYRKLESGLNNSGPKLHYREEIKIYKKNKPLIQAFNEEEKSHIDNRVYSKIKRLFIQIMERNLQNKYFFSTFCYCIHFILTFRTRKSISTALRTLTKG